MTTVRIFGFDLNFTINIASTAPYEAGDLLETETRDKKCYFFITKVRQNISWRSIFKPFSPVSWIYEGTVLGINGNNIVVYNKSTRWNERWGEMKLAKS